MFRKFNKENKIKGIPEGVIIGQLERTTELDEKIFNRSFPSTALKPNYDPRPISTKYSLFPAYPEEKKQLLNSIHMKNIMCTKFLIREIVKLHQKVIFTM